MLSEEEKNAIERIDTIQDLIIEYGQYNADIEDVEYFLKIKNLIKKQQAEIEKKDKIIDKMGKAIYRMDAVSEYGFNTEEIIEYFTNKVERNNK